MCNKLQKCVHNSCGNIFGAWAKAVNKCTLLTFVIWLTIYIILSTNIGSWEDQSFSDQQLAWTPKVSLYPSLILLQKRRKTCPFIQILSNFSNYLHLQNNPSILNRERTKGLYGKNDDGDERRRFRIIAVIMQAKTWDDKEWSNLNTK